MTRAILELKSSWEGRNLGGTSTRVGLRVLGGFVLGNKKLFVGLGLWCELPRQEVNFGATRKRGNLALGGV